MQNRNQQRECVTVNDCFFQQRLLLLLLMQEYYYVFHLTVESKFVGKYSPSQYLSFNQLHSFVEHCTSVRWSNKSVEYPIYIVNNLYSYRLYQIFILYIINANQRLQTNFKLVVCQNQTYIYIFPLVNHVSSAFDLLNKCQYYLWCSEFKER